MPVETTDTAQGRTLAYEVQGSGTPVVFLHGLTFNRSAWRPIIERLGGAVLSVALDLPGHGGTGGTPRRLDQVAEAINATLAELEIERPTIVGHSMSGAIAMIYAASYPVRGAVVIDNPFDIRPSAQLLKQLEPQLRGDDFAGAFALFQQSMGLNLVQEPLRSELLASQNISQELILGYWDEVLNTPSAEMQARIESFMDSVDVPILAIFAEADSRNHPGERLRDAQIETWPQRGHFLHLVEPDRFSERLLEFIDYCRSGARVAKTAEQTPDM
jgi:pimeloyl-ACP methyl ester carboxylesterase